MDTKQVIIIRKDLKMRKGKIAAQAAHASMKVLLDIGYVDQEDTDLPVYVIPMSLDIDSWLTGIFTKICVSVDSEKELLDIYTTAQDSGLICSLIQDVGKTEFNGNATYTAVAIGPGKPIAIDKITGHLKLL